MSERIRIPARPTPAFVGGDVSVSAGPRDDSRGAQRFWFDVSDELLSKIGAHALEHTTAKMGERIAYEHRAEVDRVVLDFIRDKANREWMEPLIRQMVTDSLAVYLRELAEQVAQQQAFWAVAASMSDPEDDR